jgi:hypothetical protein
LRQLLSGAKTEGAFRVPCMIRWPGRIQPGSISNEMISALDWMPTLMAAAGDPEVKDKLLKGHQAGSKTFKVHLDGYNQLPYLTGKQERGARKEFIYFDDDGDVVALRYENWKVVFEEQRAQGTLRIWAEPFTKLHVPKIFNLRSDPYERADITSNLLRLAHVRRSGCVHRGPTRRGQVPGDVQGVSAASPAALSASSKANVVTPARLPPVCCCLASVTIGIADQPPECCTWAILTETDRCLITITPAEPRLANGGSPLIVRATSERFSCA